MAGQIQVTPMPFPFYYPPAIPPMLYGQGMNIPPAGQHGILPQNTLAANAVPAPGAPVVYPQISDWLRYCDRHPDRAGENFGTHIDAFNQQGYRRINQLTGSRMTVEKMSDWLSIGKGTADLLIHYAEEDVALVKSGMFSMTLADDETAAPQYE
jgi:hypothetical protein